MQKNVVVPPKSYRPGRARIRQQPLLYKSHILATSICPHGHATRLELVVVDSWHLLDKFRPYRIKLVAVCTSMTIRASKSAHQDGSVLDCTMPCRNIRCQCCRVRGKPYVSLKIAYRQTPGVLYAVCSKMCRVCICYRTTRCETGAKAVQTAHDYLHFLLTLGREKGLNDVSLCSACTVHSFLRKSVVRRVPYGTDLRPIPGTLDTALERGVALLGVKVTEINPPRLRFVMFYKVTD